MAESDVELLEVLEDTDLLLRPVGLVLVELELRSALGRKVLEAVEPFPITIASDYPNVGQEALQIAFAAIEDGVGRLKEFDIVGPEEL